jgi:hypothetical protein
MKIKENDPAQSKLIMVRPAGYRIQNGYPEYVSALTSIDQC